MSDLLSIARWFLPAEPGEKGAKGEKSSGSVPFSPFSSFSHPQAGAETPPTLAGAEPWNERAALRLVVDADTLVERLGVDGRLPAVQTAAAVVVSALATRDLETVRFAVAEFTAAVRAAAAPRQKPPAA